MVKVTKFVSSHPYISLSLLVVVGTIPIAIWCIATKNLTNNVDSLAEDLLSSLVSDIENIGKFIYPKTNSSAISLGRVIDNTPFTEIQTQMAPVLFQAFSTIPQVSQVSYISTDGLLFSYITGLNISFAVFANSSGGYTQTIDQRSGRLIGSATRSQPLNVTDTDWFHAAQRDHTTAFVGTGFGGENNETLFQRVVSLDSKKGLVSLGFPVKSLSDALNGLDLHGGELCLWTKEGTVLVHESSLNASHFIPRDCSSGELKEIKGSNLQAYCSVLEVSGVPLNYTLMFASKGEATSISNAATYMIIFMAFYAICWPLGFVVFMVRAARKEMDMRSSLKNQMEATQQAERKSMNKSQAFAQASHDIRGSLAGITGLIDLCRQEVRPGSDVDASLQQMNVCTKDLVGLLNSVLDMSKIESGKMQLEEEDFNLAKLLEDVIDFFHPMAMKKEVDVVLDLHDGSILKSSNVRGDSGKLKQILNNLVSNAVKFTEEGHISIRAWAQKPGTKSSLVLASEPKGRVVSMLSKFILCMNKDQSSSSTYEMEISNSIRNNANTMEFVFEVDDTGKGIPVEMRKSVFENYVQVRETAQGQQGTGLGLGIVQSLVRLMGGEIKITDKAMGEKGTCFQFNVLLTTSDTDMKARDDIEAGGGDYITTPNLGLTINTSLGGNMNIRNLSPRFNNCLSSSPKQEASRVVLLVKDEERRRVTEKSIKILGIKVTVVEKWEHLSLALERLFGFSPQSSMGRAESSLRNELSSTSSRELPLIGTDGVDSRSQVPRRRSTSFSAFVLLMIDANVGPFDEINDIVEQFRRSLNHGIVCKVVWLNEPTGRGSERGDICCMKPLHGSRLTRVLKMLPELGGIVPREASNEMQRQSLLRHTLIAGTSPKHTSCEIQEEEEEPSLRYNKKQGKTIMGLAPLERETWSKSVRTVPKPVGNSEDEQGTSSASYDELLRGKRVMVVDDMRTTSTVATIKLKRLGVSEVRQCDNGKEAVRLVSEGLRQREQEEEGSTKMLPFDYIFMDCQMPEMDGYEATREIRKVERKYGVHIPIIAVSGHKPGSKEAQDAIQAGMDAFLEKDMNQDQLGKIIRDIESKRTVHGGVVTN